MLATVEGICAFGTLAQIHGCGGVGRALLTSASGACAAHTTCHLRDSLQAEAEEEIRLAAEEHGEEPSDSKRARVADGAAAASEDNSDGDFDDAMEPRSEEDEELGECRQCRQLSIRSVQRQ